MLDIAIYEERAQIIGPTEAVTNEYCVLQSNITPVCLHVPCLVPNWRTSRG